MKKLIGSSSILFTLALICSLALPVGGCADDSPTAEETEQGPPLLPGSGGNENPDAGGDSPGDGSDQDPPDGETPDPGDGGEGNGEDPGVGLEPAFLLDSLALAPANQGVDLTGDGRVNNRLGAALFLAAPIVNAELSELFNEAMLLMILEFHGAQNPVDSPQFNINLLMGEITHDNPADHYSAGATVDVSGASYDIDGSALVIMEEATISGRNLDVRIESFPLVIPTDTLPLETEFHSARIVGEVVGNFEAIDGGILGGAIGREELQMAMEAIAEDLGTNVETLMGFMGDPDIDSNSDGTADAYSMAFLFTAISVQLGEIVPIQ